LRVSRVLPFEFGCSGLCRSHNSFVPSLAAITIAVMELPIQQIRRFAAAYQRRSVKCVRPHCGSYAGTFSAPDFPVLYSPRRSATLNSRSRKVPTQVHRQIRREKHDYQAHGRGNGRAPHRPDVFGMSVATRRRPTGPAAARSGGCADAQTAVPEMSPAAPVRHDDVKSRVSPEPRSIRQIPRSQFVCIRVLVRDGMTVAQGAEVYGMTVAAVERVLRQA
jgi:hypothetical protein